MTIHSRSSAKVTRVGDGSAYRRGYGPGAFYAARLISAYALGSGIFTLVRGLRGNRFVDANVGLTIIAALAICRFFDSDLGFVVRGVGFVVPKNFCGSA